MRGHYSTHPRPPSAPHPNFTSFSHAKCIQPIPLSPKTLTHSSITVESKISSKYYQCKKSQISSSMSSKLGMDETRGQKSCSPDIMEELGHTGCKEAKAGYTRGWFLALEELHAWASTEEVKMLRWHPSPRKADRGSPTGFLSPQASPPITTYVCRTYTPALTHSIIDLS